MESVAELELAANRVNMCLGAERQLLDRNAQKRRIPVTIVTGFLGAGKTSLLRYILQHKLNLHVACIVSDLAAINVDALLVANQHNKSINKIFELKADPDGNLHDFKNVVWKIISEEDNTTALDLVDYLVIETSGTTDPTQLVAAVEENFGKMTRARLDSVVTVVDGDALAQDTMQGVELCAVAIRQLQCADVVLLNKVDLLDLTKLRFARKVIEKYAPNARLYETNHSQVYLPHVLDIAPPEDVFNGGISHEKVQGQWNTGLSAWNNSIGPGASRLRVENKPRLEDVERHSEPLLAFASVAFERTEPTPLAAIHNWIQHHQPKGTLRAKGVFYIAELPRYRFVIQLSGMRRLEVENTGMWLSTRKTQFVVIGLNSSRDDSKERFDKAQALESLTTNLGTLTNHFDMSCREPILKLFERDKRFEIIAPPDQATTISFRLTCPTSALDETMLRHYHHVDMNELTRRLVREVNASGSGSLLLYASYSDSNDIERDRFYAVASIIGPASVLNMWHDLDIRAEAIIDEVKVKLANCFCGF
ncbi:putative cobalamin (vitamin B12) biosynthesis CobW [Plasmopara halstedii]